MGKKDPRVDAYIEKAPDFAQPILIELRETVHTVCPAVEETLKWSHPAFLYKGLLCGMASFKQHAVFRFHKWELVDGRQAGGSPAMGHFGAITTVSALPSRKVLAGYLKQAMALNENGVKAPAPVLRRAAPVVVPEDLAAALRKNKKAQAAFDKFPPSHQREYVEWITQAKREETRTRRLQTAIQQISEGKPQNWKYMK
jgi:uncharacterized protein YdeI (YjbR/CyaY-like superfamily)